MEGDPPSPVAPPPGCRFHPRCPYATERCRTERPLLRAMEGDHTVACHHAETLAAGAVLPDAAGSAIRQTRIALFAHAVEQARRPTP